MVALSLNDADLAFAHLFEGSKKAFGTENGGSVPTTPEDWPELWLNHLYQRATPIGVYPMVENVTFSSPEGAEEPDQIVFDWGVRWGCIDLDIKREGKRRYDYETEEAAHDAATNLCAVLTQLDIDGWIEVTRSRGRHVWVFSKAFVRARTMRRALLVACEVAGVPPTEVNPKSETLAPGQRGNYVRLPYPAADLWSRCIIDPEGKTLGRKEFVAAATDSAAPSFVFHKASLLYKAPVERHLVAELVPVDDLPDEVRQKMSGLLWTIYTDGPTEGLDLDRSGWLYRLASMCATERLTPDEAALVVSLSDERHTQKYSERADGEKQIVRTVERAYAASDYEEEE